MVHPEINMSSEGANQPPQHIEQTNGITDRLKLLGTKALANTIEAQHALAAHTMERMDHKDALYADLGAYAIHGEVIQSETATGERARPRTLFERAKDRRMDKKAQKRVWNATDKARLDKIYGGVSDEAMSGTQKFIRGAGVSTQARRGKLTAREKRELKLDIKARPMPHGRKHKAHAQKKLDKSEEGAYFSSLQPVSRRWRNMRRNRAIERMKKHHKRGEALRQKEADIKESLSRQTQAEQRPPEQEGHQSDEFNFDVLDE